MGKKRSDSTGAAVWWCLVVLIAGVIAWILWRTSTSPQIATRPLATNNFDATRATNLLRWLGTNLTEKPPVVTSPIPRPAPVVTNRPVTNIVIVRPVVTNQQVLVVTNPPPAKTLAGEARPVKTALEGQIALARRAISSGPIDGVVGYQTRTALRAFQRQVGIPETGELDAATRNTLVIEEPVFTSYVVTIADLAEIHPVPETWLGKSEAKSLDFESILELVAERHQSSQPLIRSLNPTINWSNVVAHSAVKVPYVTRPTTKEKAAFVRIQLSAKVLEAFDAETNLLAHFPCSIAARVEKRPAGKLFVTKAAENPNYTFDPEVFPESAEAREIGRKLIVPPGPNNPVGVAWISLDKPGYGIHGTPRPEQVGRTESHGCFRLANWNAEYLLKIVWAGMPVYVEP
jgi:lipoprotein-anchoring transpeptidase ErfK/SrfK